MVRLSRPRRPVLLFGSTLQRRNILWRTGFRAGDPVVVVDEGARGVTLWVSRLEVGRATKEARVTRVRCWDELGVEDLVRKAGPRADGWAIRIGAILREHGLQSVDVEAGFPTQQADSLRRAGVDIRPQPNLYRERRRIKTQREILAIAAVMDAGQDALQRAVDLISAATIKDGILWHDGRPLTGDDLVRCVETRLLELGCGAEDTICCGSPDSADPHRSTSAVLRAGLPIVLDIFPFSKTTGYWGDMTRTVLRGTPDPEVQRMYDAVLDAQTTALAAVKPGVSGKAIHRIVCEVLKRHGYGTTTPGYNTIASDAKMIHGTGHGVGLDVHEDPRISDTVKDVPLQVGDVITIEPGLYDPRLGGVRIEDTVVVTRDGCRNLTSLPKRLALDTPAPAAA